MRALKVTPGPVFEEIEVKGSYVSSVYEGERLWDNIEKIIGRPAEVYGHTGFRVFEDEDPAVLDLPFCCKYGRGLYFGTIIIVKFDEVGIGVCSMSEEQSKELIVDILTETIRHRESK